MYRSFVLVILLFVSLPGFAQQNSGIKVIGKIPDASDSTLYQIQVGAFGNIQNAEKAHKRLADASLNPAYEKYLNLTLVIIKGVRAGDMPTVIERVRRVGFTEVYIKIDTGLPAPPPFGNITIKDPPTPVDKAVTVSLTPDKAVTASLTPISTALIPSMVLKEIAYRSVKVGETKSLADIVIDKNVMSWISSTPSVVSVDSNGNITGLQIGNGYIIINYNEYISVVVVPTESFYLVSDSDVAMLPKDSKTSNTATSDLDEYRTEPTFRLAYRFNNKGERKGASGVNGGIDILGRGPDYEWLWTTYRQGGWLYDLNGVKHDMVDGYQKDKFNGVDLTVKPEFVYENGVPYLQLKHILYNPNNSAITGQKFGASADVMIHRNDNAPLVLEDYGAYMADSESDPSLELMFVCQKGNGIDPVNTLWMGTFNSGLHMENIYNDKRLNIKDVDTAIGFSYQNIDLAPGESKEFIVRFTLARTED